MTDPLIGRDRTLGFSRRITAVNRRTCALWLGGTLSFLPSMGFAVGVRIMNQDPTAIGRGNAFVATADNPSAIYYNPAGITQLEGQNIQIGALAYLGIYTTYEAPNGKSFDNDPKVIPIPQIYYAFTPDSLPLSFGLGVYAPFGLSMEWPQDTGFRTRSIEAELQYATINPVIGWKPCSFFSVAAGPTISYSTIFFRSGLVSPVQVPNDEFKFDGSSWSAGFNAGILIQPHPKWSVGVNYRSASTMDYDGKTDIKSPIPQIQSGSVDTTLKTAFPQIVSFGVSYRPTPRWNIELNGDYTDWNTLNTLTFKGTSAILGNNAAVPFNWHGTWMAEAGVTYYLPSGYYVSAGYFFVGETATEQDFSPSVPDTVLHVGSVGVGYKGKHWRWAAAFQLIAGPEREISHNQANVVDGTYQLWTPTLSASLGYSF